MKNEVKTGFLKYKDINFTFVFDGKELRLISDKENREQVFKWGMSEIMPGTYTMGEPIYVEDKWLIGTCNESNKEIIFFPQKGAIGFSNYVLIVQIDAYIEKRYNIDKFDRLSFMGEEINYIYNINEFIEKKSWSDEGEVTVSTKKYDDTTTKKQKFMCDNKEIFVQFSLLRELGGRIDEPPLSVRAMMNFEFKSTNDYEFIYRLCIVAKQFVQFLCYRKNITIDRISMSSLSKDNKYEEVAQIYIVNDNAYVKSRKDKLSRVITQKLIAGFEGRILEDICNKRLYMRHIPESYENGLHINESRFIMITAAFEWEFRKLYPQGVVKRERSIKAEDEVLKKIEELIIDSIGKKKEIYKYLKGQVSLSPLKSKINMIGKDLDSIVGCFGRRLYTMNDMEFKYSIIGERVSKQRNNFAHGNLDKDFIGDSLADVIFLKYVVYAMQLKYYGVKEENIKKAISKLFCINYY